MAIILWIALAYLLGSIPTGYIAGKVIKGIDIRRHGSGNPGATNVFRIVGTVPGIVTLLIDFLKGYMPVALAANYFDGGPLALLLIGLAAIAGHLWTVFLSFHGGKGVATGAGVFIALMPSATLLAVAVFVVVAAITRYVSAGSMISSLSLVIFALVKNEPIIYAAFAALIAGLIIFRHRSNIKNIIAGKEAKIFSPRKENQ